MTARSWDGGQHVVYNDRPWWQLRDKQPQPPLRLTPLGRTALRISVAALLVIAASVGFLIRTPLDRAIAECGVLTNPCQMTHKPGIHPERTP